MCLLSSLDETTSTGVAALHMLVLGLGLGMVMQVLVLAVQNAVPYDMLGVATSGSTLFRSIGGSLGTAVLGRDLLGPRAGGRRSPARRHRQTRSALHRRAARRSSSVAAGVVVIAFAAELVHPGAAAAQDGRRHVVGDTIGGPVDTDSMRELTRALSRAVGRERTLAFMTRRGERAGVDLSPAASWALLRLGAPDAADGRRAGRAAARRAERLAAAVTSCARRPARR